MKKWIIMMIMATSLLTACAGGAKADPIKNIEENRIPVEVMKASKTIQNDEYESAGKLYANEEVKVTSKARGKIVKVYHDLGDKVGKGTTLYAIENTDLKDNWELKKSSTQKNIQDAQKKYEDDQKTYEQSKALYESGALSKNDLDKAELVLDQSKRNLEQLQKDLAINEKTFNQSISDTIVKSPINGMVANKNVTVGEMSGNEDFTIVNINPIVVKGNVSEDVINHISVGDAVKVAIQSKTYTAKVTNISPIGANDGSYYPIEAQVQNKDLTLKPGMFANLAFTIGEQKNEIFIPKNTVLSRGNENYVYVIQNNKPKKVVIQKGMTKDGMLEIKSGLKEGDYIVVKGQQYIDENTKVNVVKGLEESNKKES